MSNNGDGRPNLGSFEHTEGRPDPQSRGGDGRWSATAAAQSVRNLLVSPRGGSTPNAKTGRSVSATWDVRLSSVKKSVLAGKMVPTLSGMAKPLGRGRKRRVRVEVISRQAGSTVAPTVREVGGSDGDGAPAHVSLTRAVDAAKAGEDVEVVLRVLKPVRLAGKSRKGPSWRRSGAPAAEDEEEEGYDDDDDDESVAMSVVSTLAGVETDPETGEEWKEKYKFPIERIAVGGMHGKGKCSVIIGNGPDRQERAVVFLGDAECASFEKAVSGIQKAIQIRTSRSLMRALENSRTGDSDLAANKAEAEAHRRPAHLLIEIVSAKDLRDADVGGKSDPYVEIRLGGQVLHRTAKIDNDLNPIFTVEDDSLYLVTESMECFFSAAPHVTFEVKDYDTLGKNESLGQASVRQSRLLEMEGERVALALEMAKSRKSQGTLYIRCRRATGSDLKFMEILRAEKSYRKRRGVANQSEFVSPIVPPTKFSAVRTLKKDVETEQAAVAAANGDGEGDSSNGDGGRVKERVYRVRPMPDPAAEGGTENNKWMTKAEIDRATYEPSRSWVEAGTGKAGRLYVEILGCDGLPNMDAGINRNNKTDAFVMAIFEDAIVSTDVISDCLSPRFPPWMKRRAVKFNVSHPTSPLLLGVYDCDNVPLHDHDAVGRCAISLSSFRPNTEYVLTYDLFETAVWPKRQQFGTITIRLAIEWNDEHNLFTDSVSSPGRFYVNVQSKKNFYSAYNTIEGSKDVYAYSIDTMTEQLAELTDSFNIVFDIFDAIKHVFLWRGNRTVKIGKYDFNVPFHSMIAFTSGVLLIERPWLAPAIFTLSVAWIMLALLEQRLNRPSPWARPPSYGEMLRAYASHTEIPPQRIAANENASDDERYVKEANDKRSKAQEHVIKLYNEKMKEWEEMAEILGEGGDLDDLTTRKEKKFSTVPFRSTLYPYQVWFGQLCHMKRFVGYVLSWEHYFLSFWITSASLGLGFVFLFIPWRFLCVSLGRLFVWVFLGPWMKLLDSKKVVSKREERRREEERLRQKGEAFQETMNQLQIQKENAVKLSAMKKHVFGKFIVSMPHLFKLDRYRDEPLPSSTANPIPPGESMESKVNNSMKTTCLGQMLHGEMIPEDVNMHFALEESIEDEVNRKVKAANKRLAFLTSKKEA